MQLIGPCPRGPEKSPPTITRGRLTAGLDRILLVAAIIALFPGVISLITIRSRDLVMQRGSRHDNPSA